MSNWFRPTIAQESFKPLPQSQIKPALSIRQVLDKNNIRQFRNFGLIAFEGQGYYQVMTPDSAVNYYAANTGELFKNGDQTYAKFLARYFTQDSTSSIKGITLQKNFDAHYQPINHLLPVWKISFDRPDGMDVYIETTQSRMGTFNNNTRKAMLVFFEQLHTWQFLAAIGGEQFRVVVLLIVVGLMFFSLLSGLVIYGLFWKKFKTATENRKQAGRADKRFTHRFHRQLGLIVSFVMFTFTVSGAFHLYVKLHNGGSEEKVYSQLISTNELTASNLQLPLADSVILRSGIVKFDGKSYYQLTSGKKEVQYFDVQNGQELNGGDELYAAFLSNFYHSGAKPTAKPAITQIRQFDHEYGFINKRLPVQKVAYPNGDNWYIETSTSALATKVAGIDRAEGLSFIFLHKYFGMSWAGKNVRDVVSMLAALGVLVVSLFGFAAFLKNKL
ncbi:hypothetical protein BC343_29070 [Mucilaginibacter pedocola]|uniref:PepSY domain-containing protein n=2 Tax=Mucilaginibacter pedocola TaxID=1792845 RepID=A0A1S9PE33_9SPHI|nr:hypothetical protein BC343_29070 [Mucilaginibacter pedocola]